MTKEISEVMTTDLVSVRSTDDLLESYNKMKLCKIRHLPVMDHHRNVIGIISDEDFQRAMEPVHSGHVNSSIFGIGALVRDYMSSSIRSVPYDTELINVVKEMIDNKINAVLITKENKVVGIISHQDLLKVLSDSLYPVKDKVLESLQNWFSKTPIGEVSLSLSLNGI